MRFIALALTAVLAVGCGKKDKVQDERETVDLHPGQTLHFTLEAVARTDDNVSVSLAIDVPAGWEAIAPPHAKEVTFYDPRFRLHIYVMSFLDLEGWGDYPFHYEVCSSLAGIAKKLDDIMMCTTRTATTYSIRIGRYWEIPRGDHTLDLQCEVWSSGRDESDPWAHPDNDTIARAAALCRSVRLDEK